MTSFVAVNRPNKKHSHRTWRNIDETMKLKISTNQLVITCYLFACFFDMLTKPEETFEPTRRLESHGRSSNIDISAHVSMFDDLGIDISRIESSDTDQNYLISSARQIVDSFS